MKQIEFAEQFNKIFFAFLICVSFFGCDKSENKKSEKNNSNFEYELTEYTDLSLTSIKCTTGKKVFASFEAYCVGLNDDSLNNNCHSEGREQAFIQTKCPGTFKKSAPSPTKPPVSGNSGNGSGSGTNPGAGGGGGTSGSGNNANTISILNARFSLVMPTSNESNECRVEYERNLKELTTLSEKVLAIYPVIDIKTRIYEDVPGLHTDLKLEIKFDHGALITSIGGWIQQIEAPSMTLQSIDYLLRTGKSVKVTLAKGCEVIKNKILASEDDVYFITQMSDMKRPGVEVNPNLKFEIVEYKKDQNTCETIRSFTIDDMKNSIIQSGKESEKVNSSDITVKYAYSNSSAGQILKLTFNEKGKSDSLSVLKEYEITTLSSIAIDLMKDLKSAHTVRLSINRECTKGSFGQVHFGLMK